MVSTGRRVLVTARRAIVLLDAVIADAPGAVAGSTGALASLCERILRAEGLAVALCRRSEQRRSVWLAS